MREIDKINKVQDTINVLFSGADSNEKVREIIKAVTLQQLQYVYPDARIEVGEISISQGISGIVYNIPVKIVEPVKEVSITFSVNP